MTTPIEDLYLTPWIIRSYEDALVGTMHEYVLGRYLLSAPEPLFCTGCGLKIRLDLSTEWVTLFEIEWPSELPHEAGVRAVWESHLEELRETRPVNSNYRPKWETEETTINQHKTFISYYHKHDEPYRVIFSDPIRTKVNIAALVDYGTHGVWYKRRSSKAPETAFEKEIAPLIHCYQPQDLNHMQLFPGAFHLKQGILQRSMDAKEEMQAGFSIRPQELAEQEGQFSISFQVGPVSTRHDPKIRYYEGNKLAASLRELPGRRPELRRQHNRQLGPLPGREYILYNPHKTREKENTDGFFKWWYTGPENPKDVPRIAFRAVLNDTIDIERRIQQWDAIVGSLRPIDEVEPIPQKGWWIFKR